MGAFGGDAKNVTLFGNKKFFMYLHCSGESAGAMSAFLHLSLTSEDGLFSKVIVESMAYPITRELDVAESICNTFIASAGCNSSADRIACLRALDVETLMDVEVSESTSIEDETWRPVIDDYEVKHHNFQK